MLEVTLIIVLGLLAFAGVLHAVRGTPVEKVIGDSEHDAPPAVGDSRFAREMQLFTGTRLEPGNSVELLENGDGTYPLLWRDLAAAERTITVQMYYAKPGAVADTMAWHLAERARAGVRVLLLLDAFGGSVKREWIERLRAAGVKVERLRPLRWYSLHTVGNRSHVRVVVVDGRVGYTGGFGLADYWLGDGRSDKQWRETNVRFEGPAVTELQAAFAAAWAEASGRLLTGESFFPPAPRREGGVTAGLLYATPTVGSTDAERFLALSIAAARRTLYVANSYFTPDDDFRRLLLQAARRGVDVRVITAGPRTDVKTTRYAGRARYEELLKGGVRIYEYQPTMMHAKTLVADGQWCTVGTLNFDNRSLAHNNESNLIVLDAALGAAMEASFVRDLTYCVEITLPEWRRRPWTSRVVEQTAHALARVL